MPTKTWVVGEEVLAADFNAMVQQQVVATFPNAAARTAAIAAPVEGAVTYLADVDSLELWTGAAWRKVRHEATSQAVVGARVSKTIIPGSGGQTTLTMTGWASTPVVHAMLLQSFAWFLTLGAVSATSVNIWGWAAGGTALPDNAGLDLWIIAVGTPSGPTQPTIT